MLAVNEVETYGEAVGPGAAWIRQRSRSSAHKGEVLGGQEIQAMTGKKASVPFPGVELGRWNCCADVGGGPDRVQPGQGTGTRHRWLPFC